MNEFIQETLIVTMMRYYCFNLVFVAFWVFTCTTNIAMQRSSKYKNQMFGWRLRKFILSRSII